MSKFNFYLDLLMMWSVILPQQQQLQALMETLSSTEPHYVRCIKPNSLNYPQKFENGSVLQQLRSGVSTIDFSHHFIVFEVRLLSMISPFFTICFLGL
jgi:hypothetical protein